MPDGVVAVGVAELDPVEREDVSATERPGWQTGGTAQRAVEGLSRAVDRELSCLGLTGRTRSNGDQQTVFIVWADPPGRPCAVLIREAGRVPYRSYCLPRRDAAAASFGIGHPLLGASVRQQPDGPREGVTRVDIHLRASLDAPEDVLWCEAADVLCVRPSESPARLAGGVTDVLERWPGCTVVATGSRDCTLAAVRCGPLVRVRSAVAPVGSGLMLRSELFASLIHGWVSTSRPAAALRSLLVLVPGAAAWHGQRYGVAVRPVPTSKPG